MSRGKNDSGLRALTWKQKAFVKAYCSEGTRFNALQSYAAAYLGRQINSKDPSWKTCSVNGTKMTNNTAVMDAVRDELARRQNGLDVANEFDFMRDLKLYAFYNPVDLINYKGKFIGEGKDLKSLGELGKCIQKIKFDKDGSYTLELVDRRPYMELLGKYLRIVKESEVDTKPIKGMLILPQKLTTEEWSEREAEIKAREQKGVGADTKANEGVGLSGN